jgi:ferredoxin
MLNNPDVTVRTRGVVEKCTYCVQRINSARIRAEKEGRKVRDGEILTACQAACPTGAILFGDLNDPDSRLRRLASDPRAYGLLAELNTRPRTRYLARLRNPNPEIGTEGVKERLNSRGEGSLRLNDVAPTTSSRHRGHRLQSLSAFFHNFTESAHG